MSTIPNRPFLNETFSPRGGGIDFLGMRQVNLHMLQKYLIPGINNATSDFGTYCLAAWIPWKFQQLATSKEDFTVSRYRKYREAVEIAIAYSQRNESPANARYGIPRTRIGVQQKIDLSAALTFEAAKRTDATSLFAAPLYGPSLRYLNLITGDAVAIDGTTTRIPLTAKDELTSLLVSEVESSLRTRSPYSCFDRLDVPVITSDELDELGLNGFHPSFYRNARAEVKLAFLKKFLMPESVNEAAGYRRRTAQLICESIKHHSFSDPNELRACWYSGLLPSGETLHLADDEVARHRERWC